VIQLFFTIRILDIIDILLVAFLIYELFMLVKGTAAFNIMMGIFIFYITWIIVKGLNMELLGSIMGQVIGVGVLALIVVFQQEIRKVFLLLGTRYNLFNKNMSIEKLFTREHIQMSEELLAELLDACESMSQQRIGALIVIRSKAELKEYVETGELINARISSALIETIFFKNSPLHDGAVIVNGNSLEAARCVLPVTDKRLENAKLGLRHRAAIGMSQATDAGVIIVSEETGAISFALAGDLYEDINIQELPSLLEKTLSN
jgi:diadenylate cyclase